MCMCGRITFPEILVMAVCMSELTFNSEENLKYCSSGIASSYKDVYSYATLV